MHDDWLVAISLGTAALGIVLLLWSLIIMEIPLSNVGDAQAAPDGEPVRLRAAVAGVQRRGNITVITVRQDAFLDVIMFDAPNVTLTPGECVIVRGKRSSYQGDAQLAGTRITRCEYDLREQK